MESIVKHSNGAAQGGAGVPIPRDIQGITGGGTQCSALVENMATGWT